ncbi:TetR/AcrR family transcriptional regulator [Spirillospora sp. CA-294931]|uniref:TetR/AcrR family transcriptional regulator n=1 Tax=Spirillospora sp. CA-294931 TaxID=3240042 RepID=UPI003D917D94
MVSAPRGRYAGRTATERRAERRERFLAAGLELYGTEGYAAASTERLCAAAGLSTRQFYEEFTNRDEVLLELYDRINDEATAAVTETVRAAEERGAGIDELIRDGLRAYVTTTASDLRRAQIAFVAVVGVSQAIEKHRLERRARWVDLICEVADAAARRGQVPHRDNRLVVTAFNGATNELVHTWCLSEPKAPLDDIVEALARLLIGALVLPDS